MTTVVFGATGNVGKHVAAGLKSRGVRARLTSRNLDRARFPPGADVVAADLDRPETLPVALEDAQQVFLYAKPDGIDEFVTAAESSGVRHVVLLSSSAVLTDVSGTDPIARAHAVVESAIEMSSLEWTFVRPGIFAGNALWWWQKSISEEAAVRLPYPDAWTSPIHEKDLAALVVAALTEPGHHDRAYNVSGPESLTLRRQVQHIGEAIGRDITVEQVSVPQARVELLKTLPPIAVDGILAGWTAGITAPSPLTNVAELTGLQAHTFAQWAADHAAEFR
ncbi:SDR family oxidoreductase [Nocardia sp. NPDC003963]